MADQSETYTVTVSLKDEVSEALGKASSAQSGLHLRLGNIQAEGEKGFNNLRAILDRINMSMGGVNAATASFSSALVTTAKQFAEHMASMPGVLQGIERGFGSIATVVEGVGFRAALGVAGVAASAATAIYALQRIARSYADAETAARNFQDSVGMSNQQIRQFERVGQMLGDNTEQARQELTKVSRLIEDLSTGEESKLYQALASHKGGEALANELMEMRKKGVDVDTIMKKFFEEVGKWDPAAQMELSNRQIGIQLKYIQHYAEEAKHALPVYELPKEQLDALEKAYTSLIALVTEWDQRIENAATRVSRNFEAMVVPQLKKFMDDLVKSGFLEFLDTLSAAAVAAMGNFGKLLDFIQKVMDAVVDAQKWLQEHSYLNWVAPWIAKKAEEFLEWQKSRVVEPEGSPALSPPAAKPEHEAHAKPEHGEHGEATHLLSIGEESTGQREPFAREATEQLPILLQESLQYERDSTEFAREIRDVMVWLRATIEGKKDGGVEGLGGAVGIISGETGAGPGGGGGGTSGGGGATGDYAAPTTGTGGTGGEGAATAQGGQPPGSGDGPVGRVPEGGEVGPQAAAQIALSHMGQNETVNETQLQQWFAQHNLKLDPKYTPWCAAFVNSSLSQAGIRGTGSLAAASFYKWGTGVGAKEGIQAGDVAVLPHHVMMATGRTKGDMIEIVGGNQGGRSQQGGGVTTRWIRRDSVTWRRAGDRELADLKKSQPSGGASGEAVQGTGNDPKTPSGGMTSGSVTPAQTGDKVRDAVNFFQSKGWTREQAAGIVANLQAESSLKTTETGDSGLARGLAQWHPDRQRAIEAHFGKSLSKMTYQEQLEAVHWEMTEGSERGAGKALSRATSAEAAGATVSRLYERPLRRDYEMGVRGGRAAQILRQYPQEALPQQSTGQAARAVDRDLSNQRDSGTMAQMARVQVNVNNAPRGVQVKAEGDGAFKDNVETSVSRNVGAGAE